MAQAAARIAYADLDNIPVDTMIGERKTVELKDNLAFARFLKAIVETFPEHLKDPKDDERYFTQYFYDYVK